MQKTPSKEEEYLKRYQYLVKRAVARLLSHYYLGTTIIDEEDLCQAGNIALLKAIRGFDVSRKVKFETYATTAIRNAIVEELSKFKGPFVFGKDTGRIFRFIAYLVNVGVQDIDICKQLEISEYKLMHLKKLITMVNEMVTPNTKYINDAYGAMEAKDVLQTIFNNMNLSKHEKAIVEGKMIDRSFEAIGQELGFSREKARKMYYGILEKIRDETDG